MFYATKNVFLPFEYMQIRTISTANETEVKSTCNEESSSSPNQKLEDTETIPPIIVNEVNEQVIEMMRR